MQTDNLATVNSSSDINASEYCYNKFLFFSKIFVTISSLSQITIGILSKIPQCQNSGFDLSETIFSNGMIELFLLIPLFKMNKKYNERETFSCINLIIYYYKYSWFLIILEIHTQNYCNISKFFSPFIIFETIFGLIWFIIFLTNSK